MLVRPLDFACEVELIEAKASQFNLLKSFNILSDLLQKPDDEALIPCEGFLTKRPSSAPAAEPGVTVAPQSSAANNNDSGNLDMDPPTSVTIDG